MPRHLPSISAYPVWPQRCFEPAKMQRLFHAKVGGNRERAERIPAGAEADPTGVGSNLLICPIAPQNPGGGIRHLLLQDQRDAPAAGNRHNAPNAPEQERTQTPFHRLRRASQSRQQHTNPTT